MRRGDARGAETSAERPSCLRGRELRILREGSSPRDSPSVPMFCASFPCKKAGFKEP
jgi:hypothetical protein